MFLSIFIAVLPSAGEIQKYTSPKHAGGMCLYQLGGALH